MSITSGMFTSNSNEWETPQYLFDELNSRYHFTLDPCATDENHKCDKYYTVKQDGLLQSWEGEIIFCNPPYGREIKYWVKKAYEEWDEHNIDIVMLLPARTDTRWFHDYIYGIADIQFIKGRLKFSNSKNSAPFPSMIVTYEKLDFII